MSHAAKSYVAGVAAAVVLVKPCSDATPGAAAMGGNVNRGPKGCAQAVPLGRKLGLTAAVDVSAAKGPKLTVMLVPAVPAGMLARGGADEVAAILHASTH